MPDPRSRYEEVVRLFEQAADDLGLEEEVRLLLRMPYRELHVEVPLRMDDGSVRVFPGYRDRKSTRLNSSHIQKSRMPSSA